MRKKHTLLRTTLFLAGFFFLLFFLAFSFPSEGIKISDSFGLDFESYTSFFGLEKSKETSQQDFIEEIPSEYKEIIDSNAYKRRQDSLERVKVSFQMNEIAKKKLQEFFSYLDSADTKQVRFMHYGDSQLEGDRITSQFRKNLQEKFGGGGYGLIPIVQVTNKRGLAIKRTENWKRYKGFLRKDSNIHHNNYGALISFSRYDTLDTVATFQYTILKFSYAKKYNRIKVFGRSYSSPVLFKLKRIFDKKVLFSKKIAKEQDFFTLKHSFRKGPHALELEFSGNPSPDFYGVSLESRTGVIVDNVALRGASGVFFTSQNKRVLKRMYKELKPRFIILQYGGNAVAYMKTQKKIVSYIHSLERQISLLKKLNPKAVILFVGPADMALKVKTDYKTHPNLQPLIGALKTMILDNDCIYWDVFETMGGVNAIQRWVNRTPALAIKDYIHFTRKGAAKVGNLLTEKFLDCYTAYQDTKKDTLKKEIYEE